MSRLPNISNCDWWVVAETWPSGVQVVPLVEVAAYVATASGPVATARPWASSRLPIGSCTLYASSVRLSCHTVTSFPAYASTSLKYWCPGSFGERSTVPGVAEEYDVVLGTMLAGSTAFQVAKMPGSRPVWSAVSRGSSGTRWN